MKHKLLHIILLLLTLLFASCRKEVKSIKGEVRGLSLRYMDVAIDGHSVQFDIKDAQLTNGAIMPADSVAIDYIGDLQSQEARALTVRLIPKQSRIVSLQPDTTKQLATEEATPQEQKASAEFLRISKKHGH